MGQEDRFSTTDVDVLVDTGKAVVGLRPSFSSHVSGFPARGATNTRVCGFH
jgi:hypothetical protein